MENENKTATKSTTTADNFIDEAIELCSSGPNLFFLNPLRFFTKLDASNLSSLVFELKKIKRDTPEHEKLFQAYTKINVALKSWPNGLKNIEIWQALFNLLLDNMNIRAEWDKYLGKKVDIQFGIKKGSLNEIPIDQKLKKIERELKKIQKQQLEVRKEDSDSDTEYFSFEEEQDTQRSHLRPAD